MFVTDDGTEMEWLPFLLWCCHDTDRDAALEKAVCVVSVHGGKVLSKTEADKLLAEEEFPNGRICIMRMAKNLKRRKKLKLQQMLRSLKNIGEPCYQLPEIVFA